jgi:predicted DNA-binding ribbon-helix-helix protein
MTAPGGITKRSVVIAGHRTSVSLEEPFWEALGELARERGLSVQACIAAIDSERGSSNLSSAIRVHVLAAVTGKARTAATGSPPDQPPGAGSGL